MTSSDELSNSKPALIRCSFCGKDQHQVSKIIAAKNVFICDECVFICVEIIFYPNKHKEAGNESGS